MNLRITTRAHTLIKTFCVIVSISATFARANFEVKVQRQATDMRGNVFVFPPQEEQEVPFSLYKMQNPLKGPVQDVVIMNTDKGFVPQNLYLKQNQNYRVHVVNVNESQKNSSFVLRQFSQFHGTYFGKSAQFEIQPTFEGTYVYMCPETKSEGKLYVFKDADETPELQKLGPEIAPKVPLYQPELRAPASMESLK